MDVNDNALHQAVRVVWASFASELAPTENNVTGA
jgi:hypothetical protein